VARAKLKPTVVVLALMGAAATAGIVLASKSRGGEAAMPVAGLHAPVLPTYPSPRAEVPCVETVVAAPGTLVVLRARQRGLPIRGRRLTRCPEAPTAASAPGRRSYHRYALGTNRRR